MVRASAGPPPTRKSIYPPDPPPHELISQRNSRETLSNDRSRHHTRTLPPPREQKTSPKPNRLRFSTPPTKKFTPPSEGGSGSPVGAQHRVPLLATSNGDFNEKRVSNEDSCPRCYPSNGDRFYRATGTFVPVASNNVTQPRIQHGYEHYTSRTTASYS